ncbi:MAG: hypothetical protein OEY14_17180, partial [Myxococcales bacterium]|nr:hypothetical protein [Myxococcales bacterium]
MASGEGSALEPLARGTRLSLWLLLGSAFGLFAWLGLSRFHAFHNETFDLAFYTRMAWGMARG